MQRRNFRAINVKLDHWAAECPQNKSSERPGTSANKNQNKLNAFLIYSFGAVTDGCIKSDQWYCDSGALKHIMPTKFTLKVIQNLLFQDQFV